MKSKHLIHVLSLSAAALVLLGPARSAHALDEVDRLLFGDAPAHQADPLTADGSDALDLLLTESTQDDAVAPRADRPRWTRPSEPQPSLVDSDVSHVATHPSKSSPAPHVDLVPEPSALAMGAVALVFFLLLGRRRRVG